MSLLDSASFLEIRLYYIQKDIKTGKKLIIVDDEKVEELKSKGEIIDVLETKWRPLLWKENNEVMNNASQDINPTTGDRRFNYVIYRDSIIKRCLQEWNIKGEDGSIVPVTSDNIDRLPAPVVGRLYGKYEELIEHNENELGN